MRVLIILFLLSLFTVVASAQNCQITYFENGDKASEKCYDEDMRRGNARVFDLDGNVIGEWELSRSGIYSSVNFSFHENGMIHKVRYSSHPDGGIQWFRSYTTYDKEGKKINYSEERHDDKLTLLTPDTSSRKVKKPIKKKTPESATCAVIYVSELWLDNRTDEDLIVEVTRSGESEKHEIKKGKRVKVAELILAQTYKSPKENFTLVFYTAKGYKTTIEIANNYLIDESRLKENRKAYIYDLKR